MEVLKTVLNVDLTPIVVPYCEVACIISIVFNFFFLIVTHLRRVEGFQEVLIFMRNISVGYILMSLCVLAIVPRSVTLATSTIRIPYGVLQNFDANFLNGIASFGAGCFLYTAITFCILFLYRYNVTCKTSMLSTLFSRTNIFVFLLVTAALCLAQSALIYYSAVDTTFLRDRLNRTRDLRPDLMTDITQNQTQLAVSNQQQQLQQQSAMASASAQNGQRPPGQHDESESHGQAGVTNQATFMQTTQKMEVVSIVIIPLIPLSFPVFVVLMIPALRVTAWQVCTCQAWTQNDNSGNSDINGNTVRNTNKGNNADANDETMLSDAQMKTLKNMTKKN